MRIDAFLTGISKGPAEDEDKEVVRLELFIETNRGGMEHLFWLFDHPETKRVELVTRNTGTYCCEFMRQQLEYTCEQHGAGHLCPDVLLQRPCSPEQAAELLLVARNAKYACNFCPYCGAKVVH